jgi:eukaryotic-like serine/threonine-protein kinase
MDCERWERIQQVYQSALERRPDERGAYLDQACRGDEDLHREISALLLQSDCTADLIGNRIWGAVIDAAESGCLHAGARLGCYEITGPLGEGGMGRVYRALDTRLGRAVAIKVSAEQFGARFAREAQVISALNHPNVCTLYDVGSSFLVMELLEGETLAERIDRRGALPLPHAFDIAVQVASALEAAHRSGIVHRDLKPANVMITNEGRVKVLDFGLATALGRQQAQTQVPLSSVPWGNCASATGHLLGTPAYMSPEQTRGEQVGTGADIWAYGCLLYELLAGKRAFCGDSTPDTLASILTQEPDWRALPLTTPQYLRKVMRGCLQKDPVRRLSDIFSRALYS